MRTFWIVATVILAWSLLGDAAYTMQAKADLNALAKTDPTTAAAFRSMPQWAWAAYAIATFGGTAAAVVQLLRRRLAVYLFALSLIAVLVQFGWSFLGFGIVAAKGWSAAIFPAIIVAIAAFSLLYARRKAADGTLR